MLVLVVFGNLQNKTKKTYIFNRRSNLGSLSPFNNPKALVLEALLAESSAADTASETAI